VIECPSCRAEHVANTLFCSECGACLLEQESPATAALSDDEIEWVGPGDERRANGSVQDGGPLRLHLRICNTGRVVQIPLDKTIHLGRLDPGSDSLPEVDFSQDGGLDKGVSRRHARILERAGHVVVEDLGSINGTAVNGKRLAPYLSEELHDGDQLQLGKIAVEVELSRRDSAQT
jgi:hypothetical protein